MKEKCYILILFVFLSCKLEKIPELNYPQIPKSSVVKDSFFGEQVADPYRHLEKTKDSIIISWYTKQNLFADSILSSLKNNTAFLKKEYPTTSRKSIYGKLKKTNSNRFFYTKKNENNVYQLCYKNGFDGKEIPLFNPKAYEKNYLINYIQPSWSGTKVVIGLSKNDSEFSKLITINVDTKKIYENYAPNSIPNSLGGVEWLPDESGFMYCYVPVLDKKSKDYLKNSSSVIYKLNDKPEHRKKILSKANTPEIDITNSNIPLVYLQNRKSKYTLGAIYNGSIYRDTYITNTDNINNPNWSLFYGKEERINRFFITNDEFYYTTSKNSPNFRLCKTKINSPNFNRPDVLVDNDSLSILTDFSLTKQGVFYVKTTNGVSAELFLIDRKKSIHKKIKLPKPSGSINVFSQGIESNDLWIEIEGWINFKERYSYNFEKEQFEIENLGSINSKMDDVIIEEIEIESYDGTLVPLSIIYRKGVRKNKKNKLLINAYGAFGWINSPYFYPYIEPWVTKGGIYATAHVRGGGEKGEKWKLAGHKINKKNSWKDLIACTEYLKKNYGVKEASAWGASAGGITVGRAIIEKPNLFSAAVIRVGALNPLRLEFSFNGSFRKREFGTVNDSLEFKALKEMDSYHNIDKNEQYPAILLTAGLNDSRISVWQPGKFVARMQNETNTEKPILFLVDSEGGHGFEASLEKQKNELIKIMNFLFWQTK